MRRQALFTLTIILLFCCAAAGQKENYTWVYGYHAGLNFNSGAPVTMQTSMNSFEGCASVSDAEGSLLFYTNGNTVWDAQGNAMPNGTGLTGNGGALDEKPGSASQGVAVCRQPNNSKRFYIFVVESIEDLQEDPALPANLRYTVVDMSLNNGKGDVLPTEKNIILDSDVGEQMCLVKGAGCYAWLMVHSRVSPVYKAFKIGYDGIETPVLSNGLYANYYYGEMKPSGDRSKLAMVVVPDTTTGNGIIELSNFDPATGLVNNTILLDQQNDTPKYSLAFSPDDSKLYSNDYQGSLKQFDISAFPNQSAIQATMTEISTAHFCGMRLGPDGKLYMLPASGNQIGIMHNPNLPGAACGVQVNAIQLPAANLYPLTGTGGINFGTPMISIPNKNDTVYRSEAFTLCPGKTVTLSAKPEYESYVWDDGSTDASRIIAAAGTYVLYASTECGSYVDYYEVRTIDADVEITQQDTVICFGAKLRLQAHTGGGGGFNWSTGSEDSAITVSKEGTYVITTTNACGNYADSVRIGIKDCPCATFMPNAFSPNGDQLNDLFAPLISCPPATYQFHVYNRLGQRVFTSQNVTAGWDGTVHGHAADAGTYFYYLRYTSPYGVAFDKKGDVILLR